MPLVDRLALSIIRITAPAADREWIIGDVLEEVDRIRSRDGDATARRMLVDDALRGIVHCARTRWSFTRPPEPRGDGSMSNLFRDARYAMRLLRRSPGFTLTAVMTLALSIAANTAIFSAVKGVLISPLPYPDPDRLVRLFEESDRTPHFPMSPTDFRDYRDELQSFEGIAAFLRGDLQIGDPSHPEQLRGMQVTSGFFGVLGYRPAMGRDFEVSDEIAGNSDVVILSHALWMRRFSGDPGVIGRSIRLSGK